MLDSAENKHKILLKFLENCAIYGASEEILEKSLEECGFKAQNKELIFENGVFGLVEFYVDDLIENLSDKISSESGFASLKIRQKIKFAVFQLFLLQKPHQSALKALARYFYDPKNLIEQNGLRGFIFAFKISARFADEIWRAIGDISTDFNFYSKRAVLVKIIIRTFFVFIKDESEDLRKTSDFIDDQIEKVMKFEKFKAKFKEVSCEMAEKIKDPKNFVKSLPFVRLFF